MSVKKNLDSNLKETIKIFEDNHIDYWICHGTLLGIIRDDDLIPWDHDIDIAVWDNQEIKDKIKKLMLTNFFHLKDKFLIKDDLLTFTKTGGREIDINFYKVKGEGPNKIAYIEWFVPKNNFFKLIDALSKAKSYNGKYKKFICKFYLFENFFKILKVYLIRKNFFFKSMGYTQPFDFLKSFKKISFKSIELIIPSKSEDYLTCVYGKNWKQPEKNFNWTKDSPSTREN